MKFDRLFQLFIGSIRRGNRRRKCNVQGWGRADPRHFQIFSVLTFFSICLCWQWITQRLSFGNYYADQFSYQAFIKDTIYGTIFWKMWCNVEANPTFTPILLLPVIFRAICINRHKIPDEINCETKDRSEEVKKSLTCWNFHQMASSVPIQGSKLKALQKY